MYLNIALHVINLEVARELLQMGWGYRNLHWTVDKRYHFKVCVFDLKGQKTKSGCICLHLLRFFDQKKNSRENGSMF